MTVEADCYADLMEIAPKLPAGYQELPQDLRERIRAAQTRAALAVNQELVIPYWTIGRDLNHRFQAEGWGTQD